MSPMQTSEPGRESTPVLARVKRIVVWVAGIALTLFVLDQLGVPVGDWIRELFKEIRAVPPAAIVGGVVLETLQTVFAALTWLTILRAAFLAPRRRSDPCGLVRRRGGPQQLPTGEHRDARHAADVRDADRRSDLRGRVLGLRHLEDPVTVLSIAVYVYLFAGVSRSLSIEVGFVSAHPAASALIATGTVVL